MCFLECIGSLIKYDQHLFCGQVFIQWVTRWEDYHYHQFWRETGGIAPFCPDTFGIILASFTSLGARVFCNDFHWLCQAKLGHILQATRWVSDRLNQKDQVVRADDLRNHRSRYHLIGCIWVHGDEMPKSMRFFRDFSLVPPWFSPFSRNTTICFCERISMGCAAKHSPTSPTSQTCTLRYEELSVVSFDDLYRIRKLFGLIQHWQHRFIDLLGYPHFVVNYLRHVLDEILRVRTWSFSALFSTCSWDHHLLQSCVEICDMNINIDVWEMIPAYQICKIYFQ